MRYQVLLTREAEHDIEGIYGYVAEQDSIQNADRILEGLEETWGRLSKFPERGNIPKELRLLGMNEFREVHYHPYRLIYRVLDRQVVIYCILDGRRDMQSLLQRRLLS